MLLETCSKKEEAKPAAKPLAAPAALTSSHLTLTDDEFAVVSAAVGRVIPADESPGAVEAGVPGYVDRALATPAMEKVKRDFVPGVAALDRRAQRMFKTGFASATPAQQDELLGIFKDSPAGTGESKWYELLVVLTLEGFLGDPSYGGNKDKVGWKLVNFELIGGAAVSPEPGYDGTKALKHLKCGDGKGC